VTVTKKHGFASMAQNTAKLAGSSSAFVANLPDNPCLARDRTDFSLERHLAVGDQYGHEYR
jgi:hypothetical protein